MRRLGELHAAGLELLVGGVAVVGGEENGAGEPLRDDLITWSRVASSITGGPGTAISTSDTSSWPGGPTVSHRKPNSGSLTS